MSLEGREGLLTSAIAWPSLNQYPTKEQKGRSPRSKGSCGCVVTSYSQPGALSPLAHTFVQPSQVGCICLCFNILSLHISALSDLEMSFNASYYSHFSQTSLNVLSFAFQHVNLLHKNLLGIILFWNCVPFLRSI